VFHEAIADIVVVGDPRAPARVELRFPEDSRGE
jgi:hypothetical protein